MQLDFFDQTANDILGAKTYQEFKEALLKSNCTKCRLGQSRTHIVVDRGNPESKVVVIGEGPGADEDAQGKAFVGRAGQLMDKMFRNVGMDTHRDVLIINVVKCRPPENRQPSQDEADTCIPFLRKQLELVQPRVLVLLGATAVKHIIGKKEIESMESVAGQFIASASYPNAKLYVMYHPAYILRDPRKTPVFEGHLKKLKEFLIQEKLFTPQ